MKKVTLSLLLASLFFISIPTLSQKNYTPGYVVLLNGDTARGLINYRRWDYNPSDISFVRQAGADEIRYSPSIIRSFSVSGEIYESAFVDLEKSPDQTHELKTDPAPVLEKDTVFLQVLFSGEKTLLFHKDRLGNQNYFIHDNGFKLLIYKKYIENVEIGGVPKRMVATNDEFRRQLFFYLNNCPNIQSKIEAVRYESSPLTRLFVSYHECIGKKVNFADERRTLEAEGGLLAGATGSGLKVTGEITTHSNLVMPTYNTSISPSLGLFLNLKMLRSRGFTLSNNLFYSSFDITGTGTDREGYPVTNKFSYGSIKMHNVLQFSPVKSGLVFIEAGVSTAGFVKKDYSLRVTYPSGAISERTFSSRSYELGGIGGVGIKIGRITAVARYERSTGISQMLLVGARGRYLHFLLTYALFKKR